MAQSITLHELVLFKRVDGHASPTYDSWPQKTPSRDHCRLNSNTMKLSVAAWGMKTISSKENSLLNIWQINVVIRMPNSIRETVHLMMPLA